MANASTQKVQPVNLPGEDFSNAGADGTFAGVEIRKHA